MTIFQSSYSLRPSEMLPGQLMEQMSPSRKTGRAARGLIKAGYGVFKPATVGNAGTDMLDPGECYHYPSPAAAADVDAIVTTFASAATANTLNGSELNGVVGGTEMQPARKVTIVTSSHADWDAGNAVVTGVNHLGQTVAETIAMANGGNETLTSTTLFRSVTSVVIPAGSGTGGTATIGVAALDSLALIDFLGVAIRKPVKTTIATAGLYGYPGVTSNLITADYVDAEMVSVLTAGGIAVFTEEAVSDRDPVYVRVASGAGGSVVGAFRNDADTASAVLVTGARFCRDAAAGVAWANFLSNG